MVIRILESDLADSVADALQFISYYHPRDFIQALSAAYSKEPEGPAKDAITQILINSRLCAEGHRPLCQDTGIVSIFIEWGQGCMLDSDASLQYIVDRGVRKAYCDPTNPLRASIVADPLFDRKNTGDNTPSVVHVNMVPGNTVQVHVTAKGGGSENKSKLAMLNPSDSILDWVLDVVPKMGAGWCPPGMLGIGIGGTADQAVRLAKRSLLAPIDMQTLKLRGPASTEEAFRIELYDKINELGIGAQGLGGLTTVLDVKIETWPTHAASMPVAVIPNCAATRHTSFILDGSGPSYIEPPELCDWPDLIWTPPKGVKTVDLDHLTKEEVATWRVGDRLLLNGRLLTGRDAAHKRIQDLWDRGDKLPVSFKDRVIYYVGPVDAVGDEAVGPAGPTTATRMDKFTEMMLAKTGLIAMLGKAERSPATAKAIADHGAAYLIAVGGAAYLVARAIKEARVIAFEDLGMEAIHEFIIKDMPVTVAVDTTGANIHEAGPRHWRTKIAEDKMRTK